MADSYSVSQVTDYIYSKLKTDGMLLNINVRGEVSNLSISGGHAYFSLKDEFCVIRCVYFRAPAAFRNLVQNGDEVIVNGGIDVYKRGGTYNINVRGVTPAGAGLLAARFEQLKAKLGAIGCFDASRKKPLPDIPKRVGVVTSASGAALKDIIRVAEGRLKCAEIVVYPAKVQGVGAAATVVKGIEYFNRTGDVDVIIVARGGGSYEDLFEFNDEKLVLAVCSSAIPIVSGVGHEVDISLCDLAADVRAATPSNAAEIVFPQAEYISELVNARIYDMRMAVNAKISEQRSKLLALNATLNRLSPAAQMALKRAELERLSTEMSLCIHKKINEAANKLEIYKEKLKSSNVMSVLERGFILALKEGEYIRSANDVLKGDTLKLRFSDGVAEVQVNSVEKDS